MLDKTLFIVGAGFMGTGIAQNAAMKGLRVMVYDVSEKQLEKSRKNLEKEIGKLVSRGKMTEAEGRETLERIDFAKEIRDCSKADVIIEAASENKEIKKGLSEKVTATRSSISAFWNF